MTAASTPVHNFAPDDNRNSSSDAAPQTHYVPMRTPRLESSADVVEFAVDGEKAKASGGTGSSNDADATGDKKEKRTRAAAMPFSQLYRYATPMDKVLLAAGVIVASANGALFPCMALAFGKAITAFGQAGKAVGMNAVNSAAFDYFLIALGLFVTDYLGYVLFSHTVERQMKLLRDEALKHMLYLDIAWYDSTDAMQLSSRLVGDTVKIKNGMGHKLGEAFKYVSQFLTGYAIGFSKG